LLAGDDRWRSNWRVICPPESVPLELGRSPRKHRALGRQIRALPAGTPVVLFGSAPGALRRCRAFAERAGLKLEREYLAFPSARAPAYLVEDAPASRQAFAGKVLVVPPRTGFATLMETCLAVLRVLSPGRGIRWIAPGRVVVGRRA
jgi:hypothetical protein